MKRADRDLLIFKALCALYEYADACRARPIKATSGLRFTLAYLYSQSNGDRSCYDEFIETVQGRPRVQSVSGMSDYGRATFATTAAHGIMNSIRWHMPAAIHRLIAEAQRSENPTAVFVEGCRADPDYRKRA